jgi:hypothetical protein
MFWVLEKNLYSESSFQLLLEALDRQMVDHQIVSRIPFTVEITPDIDPQDHVYVCGSTGIGKVAKQKGWVPGYFDKNLDYEIVRNAYGEDCLNFHSLITTMAEVHRDMIRDPDGKFFTRPCADNKTYSGMVTDWESLDEWRKKVIALEESSMSTLGPNDRIVIAPLRKIYSETRFYVVDGEVITGSSYKIGMKVMYSNEVPQFIKDFAQKMVDHWQPDRAFVLDVADTDDGLKVIEINAINSSGFYAIDMGKYVNAINSMKF